MNAKVWDEQAYQAMREHNAEVLAEFERLGNRASFHFAQDHGDWTMGYSCKKRAMDLYHANPELQDAMKGLAAGFLWSLKQEL